MMNDWKADVWAQWSHKRVWCAPKIKLLQVTGTIIVSILCKCKRQISLFRILNPEQFLAVNSALYTQVPGMAVLSPSGELFLVQE